MPPVIIVPPVYVLAPDNDNNPVPDLVKSPVDPLIRVIVEEVLLLTSNVFVPFAMPLALVALTEPDVLLNTELAPKVTGTA